MQWATRKLLQPKQTREGSNYNALGTQNKRSTLFSGHCNKPLTENVCVKNVDILGHSSFLSQTKLHYRCCGFISSRQSSKAKTLPQFSPTSAIKLHKFHSTETQDIDATFLTASNSSLTALIIGF